MNNKALTLSLIMAVMAVFFVMSYVDSIEKQAKEKFGSEVMVLKARKDISEQGTINETMIGWEAIPAKFLEPGAVSIGKKGDDEGKAIDDKDTESAKKSIVGYVAIVPIKEKEQITYNKITEPGIRTGLSPQVAPGRRAMALPISENNGVTKLIKPGDRIDVIAVIDTGAGKENKIVKTLLQDIVVLSVGRNVTNNVARTIEGDPVTGKERVKSLSQDTSFSTINVEVEPQQAQVLALLLANSDNQIMFSLRNNDDSERFNAGSMTVNDVLGADAARIQRLPAGGKR